MSSKSTYLRFAFTTIMSSVAACSAYANSQLCNSALQNILPNPSVLDGSGGLVLSRQKELKIAGEELIQSIRKNYGPIELKKRSIGFDVEKAIARFQSKLGRIKTEAEFAFLISRFLIQFNDAHISIALPSKRVWKIPLEINLSSDNGHVLTYLDLEQIKKENLIEGKLPPLGARLVLIDDLDVDQYRIQKMPWLNADGNELTNKSLFGSNLFRLSESSGVPLTWMKNSGLKLKFVWTKRNEQKETTILVKYTESGTDINGNEPTPPANPKQIIEDSKVPKQSSKPNSRMTELLAQQLTAVENLFDTKTRNGQNAAEEALKTDRDKKGRTIGRRYRIGQWKPLFDLPSNFNEIKLPPDLEEAFGKMNIFAGTFVRDGLTIGLLRIPTYSVSNIAAAQKVVEYLTKTLQLKTDTLIVDQMHNPGGAVIYSDFWIQALTGKLDSNKHVHFRVRPTDHFIRNFSDLIESLNTAAVILPKEIKEPLIAEIREQLQIIKSAQSSGKILSDPISLLPFTKYFLLMSRVSEITHNGPHERDLFEDDPTHSPFLPATYRKPILFLIDQFDFSSADATPASIQDYGRGILMGTRTGAAGGTVEQFSSRLLNMQYTYQLTTSLMYRVGNPANPYIENFGVHPEIPLQPTARDLVDGHKEFFENVVRTSIKYTIAMSALLKSLQK